MDEEFEFYFDLLENEKQEENVIQKINGFYRCIRGNCLNKVSYNKDYNQMICWKHKEFAPKQSNLTCAIPYCYNKVQYNPNINKMLCEYHFIPDIEVRIDKFFIRKGKGICNYPDCNKYSSYGYDLRTMRRLTCVSHKEDGMVKYTPKRLYNLCQIPMCLNKTTTELCKDHTIYKDINIKQFIGKRKKRDICKVDGCSKFASFGYNLKLLKKVACFEHKTLGMTYYKKNYNKKLNFRK